MRTIKFRGKGINSGQWFYGSAVSFGNKAYIFKMFRLLRMEHAEVDPETVGQFTGLFDEDGHEIYEGDIIKWYEIGHSDHDVLEPPEDYIKECMGVVEFLGGTFCVGREDVPSRIPVEFLTEEWQANEDDMFKWVYNMDEYPNITVDDMYICEVVGNIHDHPELINKPTND